MLIGTCSVLSTEDMGINDLSNRRAPAPLGCAPGPHCPPGYPHGPRPGCPRTGESPAREPGRAQPASRGEPSPRTGESPAREPGRAQPANRGEPSPRTGESPAREPGCRPGAARTPPPSYCEGMHKLGLKILSLPERRDDKHLKIEVKREIKCTSLNGILSLAEVASKTALV